MRLGFSIAPTLLLFVAGAVLFFYDLGPGRMAEIRAELERRRGAY
jgi:Na+/melibiose symporter-like transporter